jgi:UDP:flavonoid glycosyltransferase YjiC (YdhE family)
MRRNRNAAMARILFAWELGGGYGHIKRMLPIAARLKELGHDITLAVRNRTAIAPLLEGRPFALVDAPFSPGPAEPPLTNSYADLLLDNGYGGSASATALLLGWLDHIGRIRPAAIVADFSPSAQLAARLAGIPAIAVGNGFSLPPRTCPLPSARPWNAAPDPGIEATEARALASINVALVHLGGRPLARLADLFEAEAEFLCTFREFDHYGGRGEADYFGCIYDTQEGAEPDWPAGGGERVFAYVSAGHPSFRDLIAALDRLRLPTLLHARGLPHGERSALARPWLAIADRLVRLDAALADCALVITQGEGTSAAALVAGRRLLLLPEQLEQTMLLYQLARRGLALGLAPAADPASLPDLLRRLIDEPAFSERAAAFARHYRGYSPGLAAEAIAEAVAALPVLSRNMPRL